MNRSSTQVISCHLRTIFSLGAVSVLTDAELLRRFLNGRDGEAEAAFRVLVERHGPLVLGVCRRMLPDFHAAEDAFQATFLVLARRAGTAQRQERLANWIYGVAVRAAKQIRRSEARRQARERASGGRPRVELPADHVAIQKDQAFVLDEEVSRLPERYRAAIVACELEGKSREEAAIQLGMPEGTLSTHLARAKKLLRERLERRGFDATIPPLAGLARTLDSGSLLSGRVTTTTRTALALLSGDVGTIPASVASVLNSIWRANLMSKAILTACAGVSIAILALTGVGRAQPTEDPGTQKSAVDASKGSRITSSIDGDKLKMNLEIPLDLVVPESVILRGQGKELEIQVGPRLLRQAVGHTGPVNVVAFSPNGERVLSGSGWPWGDRTIRLWEVATGTEIKRLLPSNEDPGPTTHGPREAPGEIRGLAFTPDGRQALSGATGGIVQLWDLETGNEVRRLQGHTGTIYDLAISPDGKRALTGGRDKTARLWDLASGRLIFELKGHTGWVRSVAFSPDGRRALTGAGPKDHTMRLWDLETGRQMKSIEQAGIVRSLSFSADGTQAIAAVNPEVHNAAGVIHLWDLEQGVEVRKFEGHEFAVTSLSVSSDGKRLLSTSYDGTVRLWDLASGRELSRLTGHAEWIWSVAFSPRGDLAVSGGGGTGGDETVAPGRDFALRLWELSGPPRIKSVVPDQR